MNASNLTVSVEKVPPHCQFRFFHLANDLNDIGKNVTPKQVVSKVLENHLSYTFDPATGVVGVFYPGCGTRVATIESEQWKPITLRTLDIPT